MISSLFRAGLRESRLLTLRIGENLKTLASDTGRTYISEPIKNGNAGQAIIGVPAGIVRGALEFGDAVFEGALNRKLDLQTSNRIIRDVETVGTDVRQMIGNLVTLKPWQAAKNVGGLALTAFRAPQSALLDIMDQAGGFDSNRRSVSASSSEYSLAA